MSCCDKFPSIVLLSQEENKDTTITCLKIRFRVYPNVSRFTLHGQCPYEELRTCSMCPTVTISDSTSNVYTQK